MPLIYDPEYQREMETIVAKARKRNARARMVRLGVNAVILAAALYVAESIGLQEQQVLSVVVVAATLCVIATINSAADAIHGSLVVQISVLEWVGRKQLGEYDRPSGGAADDGG